MKNSEFMTQFPAFPAVNRDSVGDFELRAARFPDEAPAGTRATAPTGEDVLVVDDRSGLSPAQMVEDKLSRMLKEASMPASHLQMRSMLRSR